MHGLGSTSGFDFGRGGVRRSFVWRFFNCDQPTPNKARIAKSRRENQKLERWMTDKREINVLSMEYTNRERKVEIEE
jgi:hypothetical protein